jgi:hypothetical protein
MSIGAIGGVSAQSSIPASSVHGVESKEVPGAPDHDGDADDTGVKVASAKASGTTAPGRVDVSA